MISVIVPVRNGMPWLEAQLRALTGQDFDEPWELIVADNGSTDGSMELVRQISDGLRSIRSIDASVVEGAGAARNLGARVAHGELLVFCDADDVVQPGWLRGWARVLAEADVAGGRTDYWSLNGVAAPSPASPRVPPVKRQFEFLDAALSSNLGVRREAFETVGGFSEELVAGEDTDLCWRMQLAGYRFVVGESLIARRERSGFRRIFERSVAYGRCGPLLYRRHRSSGLCSDPRAAARAWAWLLISLPRLFSPEFRPRWAAAAGWRVGRLLESARQRVLFP